MLQCRTVCQAGAWANPARLTFTSVTFVSNATTHKTQLEILGRLSSTIPTATSSPMTVVQDLNSRLQPHTVNSSSTPNTATLYKQTPPDCHVLTSYPVSCSLSSRPSRVLFSRSSHVHFVRLPVKQHLRSTPAWGATPASLN